MYHLLSNIEPKWILCRVSVWIPPRTLCHELNLEASELVPRSACTGHQPWTSILPALAAGPQKYPTASGWLPKEWLRPNLSGRLLFLSL